VSRQTSDGLRPQAGPPAWSLRLGKRDACPTWDFEGSASVRFRRHRHKRPRRPFPLLAAGAAGRFGFGERAFAGWVRICGRRPVGFFDGSDAGAHPTAAEATALPGTLGVPRRGGFHARGFVCLWGRLPTRQRSAVATTARQRAFRKS
jgi:hypothetical protein